MKKIRKKFSNANITDQELHEAFNQCDEDGKGQIPIKKLKVFFLDFFNNYKFIR